MIIMHLADLHIGKIVNEYSMLEDQRIVLQQALHVLDTRDVSCVVIAGDIYDRSIPPVEAVDMFDYFLTEISKRRIPVLIVSGNHDSATRLGFGNELLKHQNVYITNGFGKKLEYIDLEDSYGCLRFYLLPFVKPQQVRYALEDDSIHSYQDAIAAIMNRTELDTSVRNILVTHQFVTCEGKPVEESDSEVMLSTGGVDAVDAGLFEGFEYVALGHLHGPQRIGNDTVRYSGSPLKYSLSEEKQKKSITLAMIPAKGEKVQIEQIPFVPRRDMRRITGSIDQLLDKNTNVGNEEDYIGVILTNQEAVLDPMGRLRSRFPNILSLTFERNQEQFDHKQAEFEQMKLRAPEELIADFYSYVTGEPFSEECKKQVEELMQEAMEVCNASE